MLVEIKKFQKKQIKIFNQIQTQKVAAKTYDLFFDQDAMYSEIKSNKETISRLRWQFCRWPICESPKFGYDDLIYSAIVFSTKGRLRHIFYFHRACWKQFKAKCGIQQPIQIGQRTLTQ